MSLKTPLIVIVGPTASGKSALGMQLAQKWNGEIICADSRTVYKGMDIGTAKPCGADQAAIPHHLLNIVEPDESFTAAQFKVLASQAIDDIARRGHTPIMVGGSGLYVDGLIFDYKFGDVADPRQRSQLQQMTVDELQAICREKNIELPTNDQNKRHLIRAIELGGLPKNDRLLRANTIVVGIATDRGELRHRVEQRAQAMVEQGITDEVRRLAGRYGWEAEAMTGNIYRIFRGVIEGTKTTDQAVQEAIQSDMQLAKRQMTWFKRNPHVIWGTPDELSEHVDAFLQSS